MTGVRLSTGAGIIFSLPRLFPDRLWSHSGSYLTSTRNKVFEGKAARTWGWPFTSI